MQARNFSLSLADDGTARLTLTLKDPERAGVQRMSQSLDEADTRNLVLFVEAVSTYRALSLPGSTSASLGETTLEHDPATDMLRMTRPLGNANQVAELPLADVETGLAPVRDDLDRRARATKFGEVISDQLDEIRTPAPEIPALSNLDDETRAEIETRLRRIAFFLLVEEAGRKGSELSSLLRAKSRAVEARAEIGAFFLTICDTLLPEPEEG